MIDIELPAGPGNIFWLKDSRHIVYRDQEDLRLVDSQTKKSRIIAALDPEISGFRPSRDNRSLYYTRASPESDVWMLQLK